MCSQAARFFCSFPYFISGCFMRHLTAFHLLWPYIPHFPSCRHREEHFPPLPHRKTQLLRLFHPGWLFPPESRGSHHQQHVQHGYPVYLYSISSPIHTGKHNSVSFTLDSFLLTMFLNLDWTITVENRAVKKAQMTLLFYPPATLTFTRINLLSSDVSYFPCSTLFISSLEAPFKA